MNGCMSCLGPQMQHLQKLSSAQSITKYKVDRQLKDTLPLCHYDELLGMISFETTSIYFAEVRSSILSKLFAGTQLEKYEKNRTDSLAAQKMLTKAFGKALLTGNVKRSFTFVQNYVCLGNRN